MNLVKLINFVTPWYHQKSCDIFRGVYKLINSLELHLTLGATSGETGILLIALQNLMVT